MDGYHYTLVAYFSNTATKYSGVPDYPDLDDQPPHPWALHKDGCLDLRADVSVLIPLKRHPETPKKKKPEQKREGKDPP
jgi:hypothetical protein